MAGNVDPTAWPEIFCLWLLFCLTVVICHKIFFFFFFFWSILLSHYYLFVMGCKGKPGNPLCTVEMMGDRIGLRCILSTKFWLWKEILI